MVNVSLPEGIRKVVGLQNFFQAFHWCQSNVAERTVSCVNFVQHNAKRIDVSLLRTRHDVRWTGAKEFGCSIE